MRSRRAFMLPDVVVGIAIVGVLLLIMTIVLSRQQQATAALAEHRRATRMAEGALIELQSGRAPQAQGERLSFRDLPAGVAPAGYRWIEIDATSGKQHSALLGLVPQKVPTPAATQSSGGRP